jgi:hypothetical protein
MQRLFYRLDGFWHAKYFLDNPVGVSARSPRGFGLC